MNKTHSVLSTLAELNNDLSRLLDYLQPVVLLTARLYVAWVFFAAGLRKLQDWDTTLFLFELEYAVPLLSPVAAAWLGTAGELVLPLLLVVGLCGRLGAIGLSVVNVVAVISLEEIAPAAFNQHVLWGALLGAVVVWGAGRFSLDGLLNTRHRFDNSQTI
ncbi:MAG: DoxX family protein [Endozoicomonas sp.]